MQITHEQTEKFKHYLNSENGGCDDDDFAASTKRRQRNEWFRLLKYGEITIKTLQCWWLQWGWRWQ